MGIAIASKTIRAGKNGKAKHPVPKLRDNYKIEELTDLILRQVDSDTRMVVSTEMLGACAGTGTRQGRWGYRNRTVLEPW